MRCPYCSYQDSKVIDSRDVDNNIRRRRECLGCGLRFTTQERIELANLLIIKKDGRREDFNRTKLLTGIRKACEKRPLPTGTIEKVVDDIETQLHQLGKAEVPSSVVGELVMDHLRHLDHIAYIRFASVYRAFADIGGLRQELDALVAGGDGATPSPGQLPLIPDQATVVKGKGHRTKAKPSSIISRRR